MIHQTTPETLIEARNLVAQFGSNRVLDDVSLNIYRGEILAIVGGSGSGKSTLLRQLVMLLEPSSGSLRLFGTSTTELNDFERIALRRRIGVMFQQGALFGDLTVAENVAMPLHEHTTLSAELIEEIAYLKVQLAGLPAKSGVLYPNELSGGMRKRAAVARALALDPELLCFDEPSSGLDPISANAIDELILNLKEMLGCTIVLVTHDMDSLWRVADRVVFLAHAHIAAQGTMSELVVSEQPDAKAFFGGPRAHVGSNTTRKNGA